MKHKNAHPLLKQARAYNALKMRADMPFEHYHKLAQMRLAEYHRLKEAQAKAAQRRLEAKQRKEKVT